MAPASDAAGSGASGAVRDALGNDTLARDSLTWVLLLAKHTDSTGDLLLVVKALSTLCQEPKLQEILMSTATEYDRFGGYDSPISKHYLSCPENAVQSIPLCRNSSVRCNGRNPHQRREERFACACRSSTRRIAVPRSEANRIRCFP